jgi:hypothetical protein
MNGITDIMSNRAVHTTASYQGLQINLLNNKIHPQISVGHLAILAFNLYQIVEIEPLIQKITLDGSYNYSRTSGQRPSYTTNQPSIQVFNLH